MEPGAKHGQGMQAHHGGRRMNGKLGIINWSGVVLGWLVAVAGGIAISLIFNELNGLVLEPTARGAGMAATPVVVSLVSGFLAYLLGRGQGRSSRR